MEILKVLTYDFINVTSYIYLYSILQEYCFLNYQVCDWNSDKIND